MTPSTNAAYGTFFGVPVALDDPTLNGTVAAWSFSVLYQSGGQWLAYHQEDPVGEIADLTQPGPLCAQAAQYGSVEAVYQQLIRPQAIVDMVACVNANRSQPPAPPAPSPANGIPLPKSEAEAISQFGTILAALKGKIPADANGMPTLP